MTKQEIVKFITTNLTEIKETSLIVTTIGMGTILKIYKLIQEGAKPNLYWFLTEIIMSVLVGISVYAVFDQFLNCNLLLTCVVCAWCAQFSTIFHDKLKILLETVFEYSFIWIKNIFINQKNKL